MKNKALKIMLALLAILLLPGAFALAEEEVAEIAPENLYILNVNGFAVEIDLSAEGSRYNCPTLNVDFPALVEIVEGDYDVLVEGIEPDDENAIEVYVTELNFENTITVTIDDKEFFLNTLPSHFPKLDARGESPLGGYYYTTLTGFVIKLDATGDVVFYREAVAHHAGPFRRIDLDGEILYAYLEMGKFPNAVKMEGVGYVQTHLMILDAQYNLYDSVPYMYPSATVPEEYPLENHDYQILAKDHYILSTYLGKEMDNIPTDLPNSDGSAQVVACILQEVVDGEIIFEWDSTNYPELYAMSVEANDYMNEVSEWSDYAHFNSLVIDPADNNFICSFRNLDAVLKIDRETGDILWVLGGTDDEFGLANAQKFHRQHNATVLEDGSIMLFDNGTLVNVLAYPIQSEEVIAALAPLEVSRVQIFTLNEETKTLEAYREYTLNGYFSPTQANAQMLDLSSNTILVGWGSRNDKINSPLFSEVNFNDNEIYFEVYHEDGVCYRVMKFDE